MAVKLTILPFFMDTRKIIYSFGTSQTLRTRKLTFYHQDSRQLLETVFAFTIETGSSYANLPANVKVLPQTGKFSNYILIFKADFK